MSGLKGETPFECVLGRTEDGVREDFSSLSPFLFKKEN